MFVSRWNQTQVHAEGGPPSARCPRDARWVLGDRNSVQMEVAPSTCNFGTSSEVLSMGFSTHCRLLVSFSRAHAGSFPPGSCGDTSPHTGFEINTDPKCAKKEVCRAARCAFGARRPAARDATRNAPEVLDVGVFLWSSARAGLRRSFVIENRAEVHEACGS